ncbi:acyl-coenzyme A thioesterase PaaI-like protein [Sphingomonas jejuensis]|uniref:Acyl-coenzyme A thioesterase PaaI-like protein n=1 Tax=Sphingomonas jejuensis TaxID=904715 RepID=A0ABX0XNZ9_9SPHN|nr:acyl-coenzyme A thioesterase PaaI-like protein [Sphingomonas jejuensis]
MPIDPEALLDFRDDPAGGGWSVAEARDADRFVAIFGVIRMRREGDGLARVRFETGPRVRNISDGVHGGYTLAVVDQALFLGLRAMGISDGMGGATIDASCQFFAALSSDKPVDAVVELLRETRRLIFLRGVIEQDGVRGAAFSGTVRKA